MSNDFFPIPIHPSYHPPQSSQPPDYSKTAYRFQITESIPIPTEPKIEAKNPFASPFDWHATMQTSLDSLYTSEWPLLFRVIPYLIAALMTLAAVVKYKDKKSFDTQSISSRLEDVVYLILMEAPEYSGTSKETLLRKKITILSEQLASSSPTQIRGKEELERFLQDLRTDLELDESYASLQLLLYEGLEEIRKEIQPSRKTLKDFEAILEKAEDEVAEEFRMDKKDINAFLQQKIQDIGGLSQCKTIDEFQDLLNRLTESIQTEKIPSNDALYFSSLRVIIKNAQNELVPKQDIEELQEVASHIQQMICENPKTQEFNEILKTGFALMRRANWSAKDPEEFYSNCSLYIDRILKHARKQTYKKQHTSILANKKINTIFENVRSYLFFSSDPHSEDYKKFFELISESILKNVHLEYIKIASVYYLKNNIPEKFQNMDRYFDDFQRLITSDVKLHLQSIDSEINKINLEIERLNKNLKYEKSKRSTLTMLIKNKKSILEELKLKKAESEIDIETILKNIKLIRKKINEGLIDYRMQKIVSPLHLEQITQRDVLYIKKDQLLAHVVMKTREIIGKARLQNSQLEDIKVKYQNLYNDIAGLPEEGIKKEAFIELVNKNFSKQNILLKTLVRDIADSIKQNLEPVSKENPWILPNPDNIRLALKPISDFLDQIRSQITESRFDHVEQIKEEIEKLHNKHFGPLLEILISARSTKEFKERIVEVFEKRVDAKEFRAKVIDAIDKFEAEFNGIYNKQHLSTISTLKRELSAVKPYFSFYEYDPVIEATIREVIAPIEAEDRPV